MASRPGKVRAPRSEEAIADLTGPIRLRRERAVRRQRRRLAVLLVAGLLSVAAVWAVAFSPLFATRAVDVRGTALLTPAQVTEAAQVPAGVPLLQQDPAVIAARVRTLAPVRDVVVVRSWPQTLGIRVTERTPVVALPVPEGFLLVDGDGVAYARVPTKPKDALPARGDAGNPAITAALGRTVGALPDTVRSLVRGVHADSPSTVTLELDKGRSVVWGGPEDSALKGQVLAVLLKQVPAAKVYDVSAPGFPTTR